MSRKKPELWHPDSFVADDEQPEREYHTCIKGTCANLVAAPGETCEPHKMKSIYRAPRNHLSF